jgi:GTP-binding protein
LHIAAELVASAAGAGDFPRDRLAEVALVGRSNVGKSSLINALVRRPLARTSAAPGKTRLANFYRVQRGSAQPFYIVDLPGYGYARAAPGSGQDGRDEAARNFNRLTEAYFSRAVRSAAAGGRPELAVTIGVLLLVDARLPGLDSALEAWAWLGSQPRPRGIVATKVDKLTRAERTRHARRFESIVGVPVPLVSARTGEGLEQLWKLIVRLQNPTAA